MKNEKGHILPTTIAISLLFIVIFIHQLNLYLLETKFNNATEDLYVLENLMMLTVKKVTSNTTANTSETQIMKYQQGNASFTITPLTSTSSLVIVTTSTKNGGIYSVRFTYDFSEKTITNWIELR
ncbi:competence type IV pilus minor pilin ComGG [Bacillus sp. PS06]|uniref:competence type IV pilus minor pilin ComGG n=1 Tax=Bacillus sp. PS06 TaxID=2764176 RepID=UPI001782B872|nr:competence type IV pilus minor pilin ComGG [Bacillus sp. PS06]MBD8071332.1 hypothetical protein [Bacillus sp. PS06]